MNPYKPPPGAQRRRRAHLARVGEGHGEGRPARQVRHPLLGEQVRGDGARHRPAAPRADRERSSRARARRAFAFARVRIGSREARRRRRPADPTRALPHGRAGLRERIRRMHAPAGGRNRSRRRRRRRPDRPRKNPGRSRVSAGAVRDGGPPSRSCRPSARRGPTPRSMETKREGSARGEPREGRPGPGPNRMMSDRRAPGTGPGHRTSESRGIRVKGHARVLSRRHRRSAARRGADSGLAPPAAAKRGRSARLGRRCRKQCYIDARTRRPGAGAGAGPGRRGPRTGRRGRPGPAGRGRCSRRRRRGRSSGSPAAGSGGDDSEMRASAAARARRLGPAAPRSPGPRRARAALPAACLDGCRDPACGSASRRRMRAPASRLTPPASSGRQRGLARRPRCRPAGGIEAHRRFPAKRPPRRLLAASSCRHAFCCQRGPARLGGVGGASPGCGRPGETNTGPQAFL